MAIEIIDGFKLSSPRPIDDRIVASGSTARNAIIYKYEGLRVFDTSDGIPYVWLSNTWKKENETGLSVPLTITPGYTATSTYRAGQILKVLNANKLLTNSNMFEVEFITPTGTITGKTIAINHTDGSTVDSTTKLHVVGTIRATGFSGNGANITNIIPSNFDTSTTKIQISQINPGAANYVLRTNSTGTSIEWVPASSLSSGTVVNSAPTSGGISGTIHYLTFATDAVPQAFLQVYKTSGQAIGVIPANGQIAVKSTSTPSTPPYSFNGFLTSGVYLSAADQVSISSGGNQRLEVSSNSVRIPSGSSAVTLGLIFGGNGTTFNTSNYGLYKQANYISTVVNSDEVLRVFSTGSSQGSGSVRVYGNGGVLSLFGRSGVSDPGSAGTFIQFYRTGGGNTALTPPDGSLTRAGYLGFESGGTSNFVINNEVSSSLINIRQNGQTLISSNITNDYGVQVINNASSKGYGLVVQGTFNSTDFGDLSSFNIARFYARVTTGSSTANTDILFLTRQGLEIGGPTNAPTTPNIHFNGDADTGIYRISDGSFGFTSNGTRKMQVSNAGISAFGSKLTALVSGGSFNTTGTSVVYVSNLGVYNSTPYKFPSASYDRIIYFVSTQYSSNDTHYYEAKVTFDGGTEIAVFQYLMNTYARFNFIVPAGCQFSILAQRTNSGAVASTYVYESRLGTGL
jgi:hypothetical protein